MKNYIYGISIFLGLILAIIGIDSAEQSSVSYLVTVIGFALVGYGEYKLGWLFDGPYDNEK